MQSEPKEDIDGIPLEHLEGIIASGEGEHRTSDIQLELRDLQLGESEEHGHDAICTEEDS